VDPKLYFILVGEYPLILVLYIDDLFLIGAEDIIARCKADLASEFEMKDIDMKNYFLGLEVWKVSREIFLVQGKYAVEILRRFRMEESKSISTLMITNPKNIDSSNSKLVDPRI
jgi:hypothetical protein